MHPLVAKKSRFKNHKGKYTLKIVNKDHFADELINPADESQWEYINLPCGKCAGCQRDRARDWMVRNCLEAMTSKSAYFFTITYDEDHMDSLELVREDLMTFIRTLRDSQRYYYDNDNIRYFGCGEYGGANGRRHFHLILYNAIIQDLEPCKVSSGELLYSSKYIDSLWTKGFIWIGVAKPGSMMYVAQYVFKKQKKNRDGEYDFAPEFVCCSTMPGIGYDWLFHHRSDIVRDHGVYLFTDHRWKLFPPPKYFYKICENINFDCQSVKDYWLKRMYEDVDEHILHDKSMRDEAYSLEKLVEAQNRMRGTI